jgi:hypothetical protein
MGRSAAAESLVKLQSQARLVRMGTHEHFGGFFVNVQAEVIGVAQMRVAGPFGEADLADELWLEPLDFGHCLTVMSSPQWPVLMVGRLLNGHSAG